MEALGVTRRIDRLGRVVLPAELRRRLRMSAGDVVDVQVLDDRIVLSKVEVQCVFCTSGEGLRVLHERPVCKSCIDELTST